MPNSAIPRQTPPPLFEVYCKTTADSKTNNNKKLIYEL